MTTPYLALIARTKSETGRFAMMAPSMNGVTRSKASQNGDDCWRTVDRPALYRQIEISFFEVLLAPEDFRAVRGANAAALSSCLPSANSVDGPFDFAGPVSTAAGVVVFHFHSYATAL